MKYVEGLLDGIGTLFGVLALCLPFILFADEPDLVDVIRAYIQSIGG